MPHYHYLIAEGGMTADAAIRGIRDADSYGSIGLVGAETYLALRSLTERGRRFAVIGGGFIGSEIAAALTMNGKEVVLFLAGENIVESIFPPGLARFVTDHYRQRGVEVLANSTVTGLETDGQRCVLRTQNGQTVAAEGVVVGIEPNTRLAEAVGLKVDDGILVDAGRCGAGPHPRTGPVSGR